MVKQKIYFELKIKIIKTHLNHPYPPIDHEIVKILFNDLINYLQNYNNPNWIVIENSTGLAFAPGSDTIIFVVDKDVIIEETD